MRSVLWLRRRQNGKKNAPTAAQALIRVAETAETALRAQGRGVGVVLENAAAKERLKVLGITPVKAETSGKGVSLLELLSGKR